MRNNRRDRNDHYSQERKFRDRSGDNYIYQRNYNEDDLAELNRYYDDYDHANDRNAGSMYESRYDDDDGSYYEGNNLSRHDNALEHFRYENESYPEYGSNRNRKRNTYENENGNDSFGTDGYGQSPSRSYRNHRDANQNNYHRDENEEYGVYEHGYSSGTITGLYGVNSYPNRNKTKGRYDYSYHESIPGITGSSPRIPYPESSYRYHDDDQRDYYGRGHSRSGNPSSRSRAYAHSSQRGRRRKTH